MSNHTNDPWEAEMSRTFDRRVRDLHEAPLSLDQVKGKAVRIRRNRRVAVAGGVLAAAAVIVPVVGFAGGALTDNDSGPPVAPQPTAKDQSGPGFSYLEDETLHLADGTTVPLPGNYVQATVLGHQVFAVANNDETGERVLHVFDEAGNELGSRGTIYSGPVLSDEQNLLAYVAADGSIVAEGAGAEFSVPAQLGENASLVAVTGGPECVTDDCVFYVNDDTAGAPVAIDNRGRADVAVPGAIHVQDVTDDGLVAVQTESQDEGSCGGIYDLTKADYLWETCDYYLFGLSTDGKYVEASHSYLDGFGTAWAAILDAETGQEVARFDPGEAAITTTVWQDPTHLLVTVFDYAEGWSIWRLGVDGETERVLGPGTKDEFRPTYVLVN